MIGRRFQPPGGTILENKKTESKKYISEEKGGSILITHFSRSMITRGKPYILMPLRFSLERFCYCVAPPERNLYYSYNF